MKKILKIHRSIVIIIGIIAAITLLALTTGLRLCIVRTTSMEPTITPYSVCLVTTRVRYEDLSIGDIVVFTRASDGEKVVHRVVEMTDEGVITRGDANRNDDGVSVTPDTLFARYIMHIPYLGYIYVFVRTPIGVVTIVALFIALAVLNIATANARRKPDSHPYPGSSQGPSSRSGHMSPGYHCDYWTG